MSKTHRFKMLSLTAIAALCLLMTGCSDDSAASNNQGGDAGWDVGETPDTGTCDPATDPSRQPDGWCLIPCTCEDVNGEPAWICQTKVCPEIDAGHEDTEDADDAQDATTCTEGDTKLDEDGCNTCTCNGGNWLCTQRACAPDDPCAGKICGEVCSTCDPGEGEACPPVMEYCGADGTCSPGGDQTCDDASCSEGDTKQVECNSCFCDDEGNWACTEQDCTNVTPCVGKTCGERCSTCDPDENGGVCPDVLEYCDANGTCSTATPVCLDAEDPCEGKACGESCMPYCPPGQACPAVMGFCDVDGACSSDMPACGI